MRSTHCGPVWPCFLALAPFLAPLLPSLASAPEWKRDGAYSFPQKDATVLCETEALRVSAWNDATFLYVQAVVLGDGDDSVGDTDDGRKIGDWSALRFDVDGDGKPTPKVDRAYTLNPWPSMPGLHYQVCVDEVGFTGLTSDSKGRGAIAYLPLESGLRARVDSFLIPLDELGRKVGESVHVAYWCSSPKPALKLNSVGYKAEKGDSGHDVPRKDYHAILLADRGRVLDASYVPDARATAAAAAPTATVPAASSKAPDRPASGQPPPEIAAESWIGWTGAQLPSLKSLAGKVVVVEFWATWCRPCVQGIPHLNDLHEKYGSKGLVILSLTNQPKKVVDEFQQKTTMKYVVGAGSESAGAYGVTGIPQAYVVGRDGKLAWYGHPQDEAFEATIRQQLEKK